MHVQQNIKYESDAVLAVVCVFQEELRPRLHNFLLPLDGSMLCLTVLHISAGLKRSVRKFKNVAM
jgi:hypothetical protein